MNGEGGWKGREGKKWRKGKEKIRRKGRGMEKETREREII